MSTVKKAESVPIGVEQAEWFVMRDFKRSNASQRAYSMLQDLGFEVFTPMQRRTIKKYGMTMDVRMPAIPDILFVHSLRAPLDEIVKSTYTLTYRYAKGGDFEHPMYVCKRDMERFIKVVEAVDNPVYYMPHEINPRMFGRNIQIIGGPLNGQEVTLLKSQGSKHKRFVVQLPTLLMATAVLDPEDMPYVILK